jgi:hypothetical protein
MSGPVQPIRSATISADGRIVVASYYDGSVLFFTGSNGKLAATLAAGSYSISKLVLSRDRKLLVGVDTNHTVWLWDVASRMVLATSPFKEEPAAILFSPNNDRLAIQTKDAEVHLMSTGLDWLNLAKPEDLIDWARGSLSASLSSNERQRFLLQDGDADEDKLRLSDLAPIPFPTPSIDRQRAAELKTCDSVAANPTDRYRQAQGIEFDKLDLKRGFAACEAAFAAFPDDRIARYQLGRLYEKSGDVKRALEHYALAANAGHATATRRIGQLIQIKAVGADAGLGSYESWMDRAAAAGDPLAQMNVAVRGARSEGPAGATLAVRTAAAAYDGKIANAAMQLAIDIESQRGDQGAREAAYFFLQLSQRIARVTEADQVDAKLQERVADHLRIVPRQLPPPSLVKLFRRVRAWRP